MATAFALPVDEWTNIHAQDCPLWLEERAQPIAAHDIEQFLADAPFTLRFEGTAAEIAPLLSHLPDTMQRDVSALAARFADAMRVDAVRVRIEGVTGNACTRMHADVTDVRLITTYAGPGTDYLPSGDPGCCPTSVPTGWVALFKGAEYGRGHAPCLHRSPAVAGTGERRLVLVIDTPFKSRD